MDLAKALGYIGQTGHASASVRAAAGKRGTVSPVVIACLPARLHPVSRMILDSFLAGRITTDDFLWGFHLPNSDYLSVAQCVLHALPLGL